MDSKSDKFSKFESEALSVSASKEQGAYSSAVRSWKDSFKPSELSQIPEDLDYHDLPVSGNFDVLRYSECS